MTIALICPELFAFQGANGSWSIRSSFWVVPPINPFGKKYVQGEEDVAEHDGRA